jgi:hemolysin-activating ACP:hemolysin acyltransferase
MENPHLYIISFLKASAPFGPLESSFKQLQRNLYKDTILHISTHQQAYAYKNIIM